MGMFVIGYQETTGSVADTIGALAKSDLPIDRFFVENELDLHGIDLTQPMPGPEPEVVGEWVDPAATTRGRGMAFSAPMIPGTEERGRTWAAATFASPAMTESRRALGQNVEVVTVLHTPDGPVCAVYLEGGDPFGDLGDLRLGGGSRLDLTQPFGEPVSPAPGAPLAHGGQAVA